jgi:hypothetical protein
MHSGKKQARLHIHNQCVETALAVHKQHTTYTNNNTQNISKHFQQQKLARHLFERCEYTIFNEPTHYLTRALNK